MKALKSIYGILALMLFYTPYSLAQSGYVEDALRFSQFNATGTARISGIGGVQHSLGGDLTNIHGNPAGLGFFQRSEVNFTAAYTDWNADTRFLSQTRGNNATNFAIPNLGVVIANTKGPLEVGDWRGGSFGISLNRQSTFNSNFSYFSDQLDQGSILDHYVDLYNDRGVPGGVDGLFFEAFLINPQQGGGYDYSPNATDRLEKSEGVERQGNLTHISFAYGANYKNKFFLGASLGIMTLNYRSINTYNETFLNDQNQETLFSSLQEDLFMDGTGVNVGVGAIYKPVDNLNIGLSFHSPTWSRINEEYFADIFANFSPPYNDPEFGSIAESDAETDIFISSFNLRTPLRLGTGLTYFFGKQGFLSADIDYVDYSSANIRSNVFNTGEENMEINQLFGQTINYRVGGEFRINTLRIRAGYAYYGDPFANPGDQNRAINQFTGGLGVKLQSFSIDFGLVHNSFNSYYSSYPGSPIAVTDNQRITGMLSLGFNF